MSIRTSLARWIGGADLRAGLPNAYDDFWYTQPGQITAAGVRIDVETAKKISAWYRGRDILATCLAMLPLQVLKRLPNDGGAEPAKTNPLFDILHDKPNVWQDSFQWRRQKMYHLIDHGNGYDRIIAGRRGFVDELRPIHPTLVTARQLDSGRLVYDIRDPKTNQTSTSTQDEIFHIRGASDDGIAGKGILEYARTSLGTATATEGYAATIFSNGMLSGGFVEVPGVLDEPAARRLAKSLVTKPGEHHMPKPLEQGAKWIANTLTPEDAQMLDSRKYTVDDIARWLGIPRLMLENADPSFGNAEQFTQNFIDFVMGPWLSLWECAIDDQLVLAPAVYFAQFTRQALVRGNFKDRIAGLVLAAGGPLMTPDEARGVEDLPKLGGKYALLRENQNVTGKPIAPDNEADDPPPTPPRKSDAKASAIVFESSARLLRKEVAEVQKLAVRHAADADAFGAALAAFYEKHAALVAQTLQMTDDDARAYCAQQYGSAAGDWPSALTLWKTDDYAAGLAALALDEAA